MANLAEKLEFVPRTGLQRTLRYRPHLKWVYYIMMGFAGIVFLASLASSLPQLLNHSPLQFITQFLTNGFWAFILLLEAQILFKPLAFVTIEVFSDRLVIHRGTKKILVPYSEVRRVNFTRLPFKGGWFTLETLKKNYRFNGNLERSEYVLESVAAFNRELVSIEDLEFYRRTAVAIDHGWNHASRKLKPKNYWFQKYVLSPLLSALVITTISGLKHHQWPSLKAFLSLSLLTLIAQVVLAYVGSLIISNIVSSKIASQLKKNPNFLRGDHQFEEKVEFESQFIQQALLVVGTTLLSLLVILK